MTDLIEQLLGTDPAFEEILVDVSASFGRDSQHQYGLASDAFLVAVVVPVAAKILRDIGMPWVTSAARYSELFRERFDHWVDQQRIQHGLDPKLAKVVGAGIRRRLEAVKDPKIRKRIEKVAEQLHPDNSDFGEA